MVKIKCSIHQPTYGGITLEHYNSLIGKCLVQVRTVEVKGKKRRRLLITCERDLPKAVVKRIESAASTVEGFGLLLHGQSEPCNVIVICFEGGKAFVDRLMTTVSELTQSMSTEDIEAAWGEVGSPDITSAMAVFAHTGSGLDRKSDADDL